MPERRFAGVALASLALLCAGLVLRPDPLDFHVYTSAGHALWRGASIYGPQVRVDGYGFTYPPFAALLLAPFATVPHAVGLSAITAISVAALAVVIRLSAPALVRSALHPRAGGALLAVAAMITCEPVRATVWDGQVNLLLAAVVLIDLLAPDWMLPPRLRGVGVGLAAAVKLTPIVFIAYLLVCRCFRAAANAVLAFGAALVFSWLVLPADSRRFWFHDLFAGSGIGDESRGSNILGLLLRTMPSGLAAGLWMVISVPVGLTGLFLARRQSRAGRDAYALGTVGVTGCLISPVTWTHHWVWCIPWLANYGLHRWHRSGVERVVTCGVATLFVALNIVPSHYLAGVPVLGPVTANAFVLGVALVSAVGVLSSRRALTRRETPGERSRSSVR